MGAHSKSNTNCIGGTQNVSAFKLIETGSSALESRLCGRFIRICTNGFSYLFLIVFHFHFLDPQISHATESVACDIGSSAKG